MTRLFQLIFPQKPLHYFWKLSLAESFVSVAKIDKARLPIRPPGFLQFVNANGLDTLAIFNLGKFVDQDLLKFFGSDFLHFCLPRLLTESNKPTIPTACVQAITGDAPSVCGESDE